MGKSKEMMMEHHDDYDEYIEEQIHLKLNADQQHYIEIYEKDINKELPHEYKN